MSADIAIIGAGLAGLTCALELQRAGISCVVFEKDGKPGGRVQTDEMDGFLLDRGFQVFLNSYPFARNVLDLDVLHLHSFDAGALLWDGAKLKRFRSPVQYPAAIFELLSGDVATLADLFKLAKLSLLQKQKSFSSDYMESVSTAAFFKEEFSEQFIKLFLTPFFQGVFLEQDLETDAAFCKFLLPLFGRGRATLPAAGMGAIPAQLAARLKQGTVQFRSEVTAVSPASVTLENSIEQSFKQVVLAVDVWSLTDLLAFEVAGLNTSQRGTGCLYFALEGDPPIKDPLLVLNGSGSGSVNSISFPSLVGSTYAPAGKTLCSVSVLSNQESDIDRQEVLTEVSQILSVETNRWRYLREYRIPESLPALPTAEIEAEGFVLAGDYTRHPSIEGAMTSGRIAAGAVLRGLEGT